MNFENSGGSFKQHRRSSRNYDIPSSQNRSTFSQGRTGEITDKGQKGFNEVNVTNNSYLRLAQDEKTKVIMGAPIYVTVDSRMKKRTRINNAYAATNKKEMVQLKNPIHAKDRTPSKPSQMDQRVPQSVLDQNSER